MQEKVNKNAHWKYSIDDLYKKKKKKFPNGQQPRQKASCLEIYLKFNIESIFLSLS